ncbi:alpha/beta fold hydrolase [Nocardioides sp. L-11A]|uniref:alpha/beta fold hydrolase n=1 Tax=Nocardioides sp. L-11A TaxID=3043848 RepID=UPI00249CBA2F|nr:alpha/beta fold hydrolase [Nocardioides sp. L-11A]
MSAAAVIVAGLPVAGSQAEQPRPARPKTVVPDTAALAGALADQQLEWSPCAFDASADCTTVVVPRDWHDPDNGLTWSIAVSQLSTVDIDDPAYRGTIFGNPGGPTVPGLDMSTVLATRSPQLRGSHNFVGFDPRGVGQSSAVPCTYTYDPADGPHAAAQARGETCSQDPDVRTITTEQTAYDMDFIRHLLGVPKLDYIGYSYGTWLGDWYARVFGPAHGGKFLLDSAIDATRSSLEDNWTVLQPIAFQRQFEARIIPWIARHDDTYGLGTDSDAILQRYEHAVAKIGLIASGVQWTLSNASGFLAFYVNAYYPHAAASVRSVIAMAESNHLAGLHGVERARASLMHLASTTTVPEQRRRSVSTARLLPKKVDGRTPTGPVTETNTLVYDYILCNDGQWTQGLRYWQNHERKMTAKAPFLAAIGALGAPACGWWETDVRKPAAPRDYPETVVVQSELDSATPWEGGYRAGTRLPNTSLIAVDNEGSHALFPYGVPKLDDAVLSFFTTSRRPRRITIVQGRPLPHEDVTYEHWARLKPNARHGRPVTPPLPVASDRRRKLRVTPWTNDRHIAAVAESQADAWFSGPLGRRLGPAALRALGLGD